MRPDARSRSAGRSSGPAWSARPSSNCVSSERASAGGAIGVDVDDGQPLGAERQRRVADRGAGPAGAEQHHAAQLGVGQPAGEARREAGAVGVVADRPPVGPEDDRVHRAERRGVRGQLVEVLEHRLLARVGDVQPREPHRPRGGDDVADRLGRQVALGDVDRLVQRVHAEPLGLALVERGAERRADARADETEEHPLGHEATASARAHRLAGARLAAMPAWAAACARASRGSRTRRRPRSGTRRPCRSATGHQASPAAADSAPAISGVKPVIAPPSWWPIAAPV